MLKTFEELTTLRDILWKLASIAGSGDMEAVKKEIKNQLEVVIFNLEYKKYRRKKIIKKS